MYRVGLSRSSVSLPFPSRDSVRGRGLGKLPSRFNLLCPVLVAETRYARMPREHAIVVTEVLTGRVTAQ